MASYKLITPPTAYPVTIVQAKQHLRIDHNDDDLALDMMISAAIERFEQSTGRVLMSQTWDYVGDAIPDDGTIRLFKCPADTLTSITVDINGTDTDVAPTDVYFDNVSMPARIVHKTTWPAIVNRPGSVRVRFTAGSASAELVPKAIRVALLMMVAHMYEHRHEVIDTSLSITPQAVETVMDMYRISEHR